jgi:hypothetical protein
VTAVSPLSKPGLERGVVERQRGHVTAAYVVPALAAATAAAAIALAAACWRRRARAAPRDVLADAPPLHSLQAARIDAELERYGR